MSQALAAASLSASCVLAGGWFVWHHFWFLDITLDSWHLRTLCALVVAAMLPAALLPGLLYSGGWAHGCVGGLGRVLPCCWALRPPLTALLSLSSPLACCQLLLQAPCLACRPSPPTALPPPPADAPRSVTGAFLLIQAALLCVLEEHLYAGNHEEVTYNVHTMYPPWLVAGTSGEWWLRGAVCCCAFGGGRRGLPGGGRGAVH
jgi:hypothetical protein